MKKVTISFLLKPGDSDYDYKCALSATKLNLSIYDALNEIRSRLKYGENVSVAETECLENIRSILNEHYIED